MTLQTHNQTIWEALCPPFTPILIEPQSPETEQSFLNNLFLGPARTWNSDGNKTTFIHEEGKSVVYL